MNFLYSLFLAAMVISMDFIIFARMASFSASGTGTARALVLTAEAIRDASSAVTMRCSFSWRSLSCHLK